MNARKRRKQRRSSQTNANSNGAEASVRATDLPSNGINPSDFENHDGNGTSKVEASRADEIPDERLDEFGMNYRLVCLIINGRSPRQALEYLKPEYAVLQNRTVRWAQKLFKQYTMYGLSALMDRRHIFKPDPSVMTGEVKKIALCWFFARPAAGYNLIAKAVAIDCKRREIPAPSYPTIKKYLGSLPEYMHKVRKGGIEAWDKEGKPVVRINITTYANQRWQIDHSRLDIWIRVWDGEKWVPAQVWLSLVLDAHTRAIPGFVLSTKHPDAWTVALLMRHAILPKENPDWKVRGIPEVVQPDNGRDFRSHAVEVSFAYLKIRLEFDPPYYPNMKGKIERFFLTLDRGLLRALPGHMNAVGHTAGAAVNYVDTLLTRKQLIREVEKFIVEDYHARTHSETKRKPGEHWEQTVKLRMPESLDSLNRMLLKFDETRKVNQVGVSFKYKGQGGDYWHPALVDCIGRDVQIRFNPEDMQRILLYDLHTGEFICEAWIMGRPDSKYMHDNVKTVRNQFRAGLVDRLEEYTKEIQEEDRRAVEEAQWAEAKRIIEETSGGTAVASLDEVEMEEVQNFLDLLERETRGEI
jgi:putative transposase